MEPAIVSGNGTEAGQIIATTVGGKNGKPKQVNFKYLLIILHLVALLLLSASPTNALEESFEILRCNLFNQTIWCLIYCKFVIEVELFENFLSYCHFLQTISYMAERVVGTGSFGVVFQVLDSAVPVLGLFRSQGWCNF